MATSVRLSLVYTVGRAMATGSCDFARCLSTTGRWGHTGLHLAVFRCRSPIAILPRRQHVHRYMHASIDCGFTLGDLPRLFGGMSCSGMGIDDDNVLHFAMGRRGRRSGSDRERLRHQEVLSISNGVRSPW